MGWVLRLDGSANLVRLSPVQTSPNKDEILAGIRWASRGPRNGIRCCSLHHPRLGIGVVYTSLPDGGSHHRRNLGNSRN